MLHRAPLLCAGVVDLRASSVRLAKEPQLVWEDMHTGAKCEAATVIMDRGISFEQAIEVRPSPNTISLTPCSPRLSQKSDRSSGAYFPTPLT